MPLINMYFPVDGMALANLMRKQDTFVAALTLDLGNKLGFPASEFIIRLLPLTRPNKTDLQSAQPLKAGFAAYAARYGKNPAKKVDVQIAWITGKSDRNKHDTEAAILEACETHLDILPKDVGIHFTEIHHDNYMSNGVRLSKVKELDPPRNQKPFIEGVQIFYPAAVLKPFDMGILATLFAQAVTQEGSPIGHENVSYIPVPVSNYYDGGVAFPLNRHGIRPYFEIQLGAKNADNAVFPQKLAERLTAHAAFRHEIPQDRIEVGLIPSNHPYLAWAVNTPGLPKILNLLGS